MKHQKGSNLTNHVDRKQSTARKWIHVVIFVAGAFSMVCCSMQPRPGCSKPLGLITGEIQDWQLSASSVRIADKYARTKFARVYESGQKAWCPQLAIDEIPVLKTRHHGHHHLTNEIDDQLSTIYYSHHIGNHSDWILVDLGVDTLVSGLLTQGRSQVNEWVTAFTLSYSLDAYTWEYVLDVYGNKKRFLANVNPNGIKEIWLEKPLEARFIKIHILEWHQYPCLRLEILGCQECASIVSGPGVGSSLTASSYASSHSLKSSCQPENGHIFSQKAWCTRQRNYEQWLQLGLGPPTKITGIVTKGRQDTGRKQWVTSYTISYSNDTLIWYYYKETNHLTPKIFGGNMDRKTERRHYFNSPFVAQFVRIHATTWNNHIAMRAALLGCPTQECPPNFFRINELAPCRENLAFQKKVWSNDKRHFWKDWKYGHASLAVNGKNDLTLPNCAVIDSYYAENPIWMVDLGKNQIIEGIIIHTWQGDGQDRVITYADYILNLDSLTVYISDSPRLDSPNIEKEKKCGSISRINNALFHPQLHFDCTAKPTKGRYVYIQSTPVSHRYTRIFNVVFCSVYVY